MELCTDSVFIRSPLGKAAAGSSWLYFHPTKDLAGFVMWGQPMEDDVARLVRVIGGMLGTPPHVTLVDVKAVTGGDPAGYTLLGQYIRDHGEDLRASMKKLAIVRRGGLLGAIA